MFLQNDSDSTNMIVILEISSTIIISIVSIILNIIISFCLLISCKALPSAIRWLVSDVSLIYLIISIYLTYKCVQSLLVIEMNWHWLDFNQSWCIFESYPFITCYLVSQIVLFATALHRLSISLTQRSLIQHLSIKRINCWLLIMWLLTSLLYFTWAFLNSTASQQKTSYCEILTISNHWPFIIIISLVQISTGTIHGLLHRYNKKQLANFEDRKQGQGLDERHKAWSAMMAIMAVKWLFTVSTLHLAMGFVVVGLASYAHWNTSAKFIHANGLIELAFAIDCTTHPILCARYSRTIQSSIRQMFSGKEKPFHIVVRRILLGSVKIEDNSKPAVISSRKTSEDHHIPKVTRIGAVCKRVIVKHNVSPETQEEILLNAWNLVSAKKEAYDDAVQGDNDGKDT